MEVVKNNMIKGKNSYEYLKVNMKESIRKDVVSFFTIGEGEGSITKLACTRIGDRLLMVSYNEIKDELLYRLDEDFFISPIKREVNWFNSIVGVREYDKGLVEPFELLFDRLYKMIE